MRACVHVVHVCTCVFVFAFEGTKCRVYSSTYVRMSVCSPLSSPPPVCIREDEPYSTKGLDDQSKAVLEKVRANTREEYLKKGSATGSVRASDRLMRELMDIYRSNSYKNGKIHTHFLLCTTCP